MSGQTSSPSDEQSSNQGTFVGVTPDGRVYQENAAGDRQTIGQADISGSAQPETAGDRAQGGSDAAGATSTQWDDAHDGDASTGEGGYTGSEGYSGADTSGQESSAYGLASGLDYSSTDGVEHDAAGDGLAAGLVGGLAGAFEGIASEGLTGGEVVVKEAVTHGAEWAGDEIVDTFGDLGEEDSGKEGTAPQGATSPSEDSADDARAGTDETSEGSGPSYDDDNSESDGGASHDGDSGMAADDGTGSGTGGSGDEAPFRGVHGSASTRERTNDTTTGLSDSAFTVGHAPAKIDPSEQR